jgi:hypothetical protein
VLLLDEACDVRDAIGRERVVREELEDARHAPLGLLERLEERHQPVRIESGGGGHAGAVLVGLALLVATEREQCALSQQRDGDLLEQRRVAAQSDRGDRLDPACSDELLRYVVQDLVADLVAQNAGHLGVVVRGGEKPAVDVQPAARRGERVERLRIVDDVQRPVHAGSIALRLREDRFGDPLQVPRDVGVVQHLRVLFQELVV